MGLSSKKTKQTTNQNTTATIMPTNPTFTTDAIGGLAGRTENYFKDLDPYSLVPGADPLQTQAGQGAAGLTTSPVFGQVAAAGPQHVDQQDIASYIPRFQSPYTNDVVKTTLAGFDQDAGRTRAQQQLDLAGDTTFGGSGGSILRSLTEGELSRNRASAEAQLRDQGFQTALGAATNQAGLNQQSSLANANFGDLALQRRLEAATGQGDQERANIGTQAGIGDILRQIAAARAGAPITALGANAGILGGTPFDLLKGSNATGSLSGTTTTKESGAGLTDWLKLAAAAAGAIAAPATGGASLAGMGAIVSDRRLKRDVVKLGEREGLGIYAYRYLWSPLRYVGVMAQEVMRVKPQAVVTMPNGFYAVDYGKL